MIELKRIGNISLRLHREPEYDLDLSFDYDGTVAAALERGALEVFVARVDCVRYCPECGEPKTLASDYLGNCIYEDLEDFAQGASVLTHCYARDMMHEVLSEARQC